MIVPPSAIQLMPFDAASLWYTLALVLLLGVSALISGSETAFFSLTPANIKSLKDSIATSKVARMIIELLEKQDYLLSTILILNNLVNIGAIIIANALLDKVLAFNDAGVWEFVIKIVVVTFVLLLFGEILPKIVSAYQPYQFAKMMAMPLSVAMKICRPLSIILIASGSGITRLLSGKGSNVSIDELSEAIDITSTDSAEDKKMLSGIVRFVGTEVAEIMRPRVDVVAVDIQENFSALRQLIIDSGHSRIPVYDENIDTIKGLLYIKDVLPHIAKDEDFEWTKLIRQPYFVPENKKINDLLEDFQEKKVHLAIVVDEYGGTLGIVSLEDILEEIVGEIADESDTDQSFYQKLDDHTYLFEGKTHIGDFARVLSILDAELEQIKNVADTLAGVMLEVKGDFLKEGDKVNVNKMTLMAEKVDNYRIIKIRVTINASDNK